MGFTYPFIEFSCNCLKNFQDEHLAFLVLTKIKESGDLFKPDVFGDFEPLKSKCGSTWIDECVKVWLNSEFNTQNQTQGYAAGQLLMKKKKNPQVNYMINWKKDDYAKFNLFSLSIEANSMRVPGKLDVFLNLCKELTRILEPVYGEILNQGFPDWANPIDLMIRLPEPQWVIFLGEPYIGMFGRDKIVTTPCVKVESVGERVWLLQIGEDLFKPIEDDSKRRVKEHLGKDAFVWGKPVRSHKEGQAPNFDFSNIVFDKLKPIITQAEVLKRNR